MWLEPIAQDGMKVRASAGAPVEAAQAEMPSAEEKREPRGKDKARVSTTDPQARMMKTANGGDRPAYEVQPAAETEHRLIVGDCVTNGGGDQPKLEPMVRKIADRTMRVTREVPADGGFVSLEAVDRLAAAGVSYTPRR